MKFSDIFRGAGYLLEGFSLIRRSGLRRFVVIPLLINVFIFIGMIYLGGSYFDQAMERLLPESAGWLGYILWPLFALLVLVSSFYTFTLVANLIGGPFNDRLSEMVAERLGAPQNTDHGRSLVGDIGVSVANELRKWLYFLSLFLMLLLMWLLTLWIPPLTLFMPLLWLLLGTWMMAVEYTDYPMSNQDMRFGAKRAWLRRHRWLAIGFGGATLGATLIPIVNFAVMPAELLALQPCGFVTASNNYGEQLPGSLCALPDRPFTFWLAGSRGGKFCQSQAIWWHLVGENG